MPFSQHTAQDRFATTPAMGDAAEGLVDREGANPWREAAILLGSKARRHLRLILLAALACAVLAGLAKTALPTAYKASAQILIDPQETRAYEKADANSTLEANAAINYVESQMGVIGSERVLLRVIRDQGLAGAPPAAAGEEASETAESRRARDLAENKALVLLQRAVTIARAERSFLVNITVTDKNPEKAARLANAVVKAYGDVNTIDRNSAARWLSTELSGRIDETRRQLGDTEAKLLDYKVAHNLVGLHDMAITERRTTEATEALAVAENREAQARARVKQLDAAPSDVGGVASFGPDPESRQLQVLLEGRAAARAEVEQLESTLGEQHPALLAGRMRMRDFDRRVGQALEGLRRAARAQLAEAQAQTAALNKKLSDFAAEITKARGSDSALHEMEDAVDAKRKALTALESRQRDANDQSRLQGASFRIVSPARIPNIQAQTLGVALFALCGGLIGAAAALAGLALAAMFDEGKPVAARPAETPASAPEGKATEREKNPDDNNVGDKDLGQLPAIAAPSARRRLGAVEAMDEVVRRPDSAYSQAVARIYDRLGPAAAGPVVVLAAATEPQAGASTLAANLARIAAARGLRTLLIDAHQAHPVQDLAIPAEAPKTLIDLAGVDRPLYRLAPFTQSLSLIPALAREDRLCRAIAEERGWRRIDGINGNFDFVVFDGPDAGAVEALRDLVPAVRHVLLVAPAFFDDADLPRLLRRLGVGRDQFAGLLHNAPRRVAAAA